LGWGGQQGPCGNCYFRVAPAVRNYRLEATSPALPPVTRDHTPSGSDPDLATAGNTLFCPSDRRHCRTNTYSSSLAGFQLRAAYSLRPCAARVRAVAIRGHSEADNVITYHKCDKYMYSVRLNSFSILLHIYLAFIVKNRNIIIKNR
jgi:hypothetical protein